MDENIIFEALGEILKSERETTNRAIESIGTDALLKSLLLNRLEAKKGALQKYANDLVHRRSEVVDGVPGHLLSKSL